MTTSTSNTFIHLSRDVNAIRIPDGIPLPLPQGTAVMIQQALGGAYTIITDTGHMARIAGADADALGKTPERLPVNLDHVDASADAIESAAWELMKTCFDPEIPVNIVELGLIYDCKVNATDANQFNIDITMTLTAPGCGMGPVLQYDVEMKLKQIPHINNVDVTLTFDPPWQQERMSEAARLQLGLL